MNGEEFEVTLDTKGERNEGQKRVNIWWVSGHHLIFAHFFCWYTFSPQCSSLSIFSYPIHPVTGWDSFHQAKWCQYSPKWLKEQKKMWRRGTKRNKRKLWSLGKLKRAADLLAPLYMLSHHKRRDENGTDRKTWNRGGKNQNGTKLYPLSLSLSAGIQWVKQEEVEKLWWDDVILCSVHFRTCCILESWPEWSDPAFASLLHMIFFFSIPLPSLCSWWNKQKMWYHNNRLKLR